MLPDADHPPIPFPEPRINHSVSLSVACDFLAPVVGVRVWNAPVLRAAVPETPVDENRTSLLKEHKVGLPDNRVIPPPAFDPEEIENRDHPQLRGPVARASDSRHHIRSFC